MEKKKKMSITELVFRCDDDFWA